VERYRDLPIGLADASLVVLADRYGTDIIGTLSPNRVRRSNTGMGDGSLPPGSLTCDP